MNLFLLGEVQQDLFIILLVGLRGLVNKQRVPERREPVAEMLGRAARLRYGRVGATVAPLPGSLFQVRQLVGALGAVAPRRVQRSTEDQAPMAQS